MPGLTPPKPDLEVDACIVGAGFSGLRMLHRFRDLGFSTICVERASGIGGTWFNNRYPGARVDSHFPTYQYSDKELWDEFNWKERFPGYDELRDYFAFVDKKWQLSKDIIFNTTVKGAKFDPLINKWNIHCEDGKLIRAQWFIAAVGFAAKPFTPSFEGLEKFTSNPEKECYHTSKWPENKSVEDFKGKRVGVIGTGSSGVQVIQEIGPIVSHLTVYQRTPTQTFPMHQRDLTLHEQDELRLNASYARSFELRQQTAWGFNFLGNSQTTFSASPSQRRALFEKLWNLGGFAFLVSGYADLIINKEANDEAWKFLAEKNRERVKDPKKKDVLIPLQTHYAVGTKRPCLEQRYLEVYNQDNVDIIDVSGNGSPITKITEKGVVTAEGEVDLDVLVLATGFDAVTGSMTQLEIEGTDGRTLAEKWEADGATTCLGIAVHNYPNMFFTYGLHAPTAFANGPTLAEIQGEWIQQVLLDCRKSGVTRFEATEQGEKVWTRKVADAWFPTLAPQTKSWYNGSNIPGKRVEPLCYAGGVPKYIQELTSSREEGYSSFAQSKGQTDKKRRYSDFLGLFRRDKQNEAVTA